MGLLDDAIRDHLDLKRRRGADPAEVERAEREALGPVRRKGDVATADYPDDVGEAFDAEADDAPAGSRLAAYDQAEHDEWDYRDDELAVHDAEPEPEPPRRSRRSVADDDADPGMRIEQLENQLRQLTGQNEELQYRNRQLEDRLKMRQGGAQGVPGGPPASVAATPPVQPPAAS